MHRRTAHMAEDSSTQLGSLSNAIKRLLYTCDKVTAQARALSFIPVEGFIEFESCLQPQNHGQTHCRALANA